MSRRRISLSGIASVALISLFAFAATSHAAEVQATFFVSPGGDDANVGAETKPFATVERARQAVRAVNQQMTGDIVVVLRGGTYAADRTITFDAADSGANGHDVVYRAAPKETPVISGGRQIRGWQPDAGKRWKAKIDLDDFRQLYVNGVRAIRARSGSPEFDVAVNHPDYAKVQDRPARMGALSGAEPIDNSGYRTTLVEMADWRNPKEIELCFVTEAWSHTRCKVESIKREGDHAIITMLQPYFTHARTKEGMQAKLPSHVENALELLDEPGEWYFDRPAKTVYYIPRPGEDLNKAEVIAPAVETLVELRGTLDKPVEHIRFEGLAFEYAGWLRPSKIGLVDVQANFITDSDRKDSFIRDNCIVNVHNENLKSPANVVCHAAKSIRFDRCTFTRLGGAGLDIEFGSQDNTVSGCRFFDISGSAVQIGDVLKDDHHPDDPRKIVKNNTVENCYIHDCCVDYMGGVGVFVGYTEGTRIAHNEICHLPYSGMSIGWGWGEEDAGGSTYPQPNKYADPTPAKNDRIEYNHIHNVMLRLDDGGGIYTLGNRSGAVIRGNHVHDNGGKPGGIYLDEGSGSIEVTGNLVYHCQTPMFYNNRNQNRIATCNEHDNFFDVKPGDAKSIVEKAGLEAAYRDLLNSR